MGFLNSKLKPRAAISKESEHVLRGPARSAAGPTEETKMTQWLLLWERCLAQGSWAGCRGWKPSPWDKKGAVQDFGRNCIQGETEMEGQAPCTMTY